MTGTPLQFRDDHDASSRVLVLEECRREIEGQRRSGPARIDDRPVFAKLFAVEADGIRRAEREAKNARRAKKKGLRTPQLIATGEAIEKNDVATKHRALIFERLNGSIDHMALGHGRIARPGLLPRHHRLFQAWGELHRHGLDQTDSHLGNMLEHEEQVHFVDVARLERLPRFGRESRRIESLGLLLSQLDPTWWSQLEDARRAYALGFQNEAPRFELLQRARAQAWQTGWKKFRKKRLRSCGDVRVLEDKTLETRRPKGSLANSEVHFDTALEAENAWLDLHVAERLGLPVASPIRLDRTTASVVVGGLEDDVESHGRIEECERRAAVVGIEGQWNACPRYRDGSELRLGLWAARPRFGLPPELASESHR